jgi:hypothetical protein
MTTTITRTITPDHRAQSPYLELPFEVAPGTPSVEVRLGVDRARGVVDLGCAAPHGFRGWSGGARSRFVITADDATPGYLPGEPEAGRWAVVLGLHRIPWEGLDVVVEIDMPAAGPVETEPPAPPTPQRRPRRQLPADAGFTWVAGDFHAHTVHSDGQRTPAEVAEAARAAGGGGGVGGAPPPPPAAAPRPPRPPARPGGGPPPPAAGVGGGRGPGGPRGPGVR